MKSFQINLNAISDFLFLPGKNKYPKANIFWLLAILVGGIFAWIYFLHCPHNQCNYHDWQDYIIPRLSFMKEAVTTGSLPLASSSPIKVGTFYTTRYMAITDAILAPQMILLSFLDVFQYIYTQVILFYLIGFWGLLWLKRKFNFSNFTFLIFFLLFNFNGHIVAQLGAGHFTWITYFLFPLFAVLIIKLLDGDTSWRWVLLMTSLMFFTLLQGGYHQFVWMLFFMGFLAISKPRYFFFLLKTSVIAVLSGMVRFLPFMSLFTSLQENEFIAGYPDFQSIIENMIHLTHAGIEEPINGLTQPIGSWETTLYIGIIGTVFILFFTLIYPLIRKSDVRKYPELIFPTAAIFLLSFDKIYHLIHTRIPVPIFTGERVVTRFIGFIFIFILIKACNEFQGWLNEHEDNSFRIYILIPLLAIAIQDLFRNFREWSVIVSAQYFPKNEYIIANWLIANDMHDTPYVYLVLWGFIATVITFLVLIFFAYREKRLQANAK